MRPITKATLPMTNDKAGCQYLIAYPYRSASNDQHCFSVKAVTCPSSTVLSN